MLKPHQIHISLLQVKVEEPILISIIIISSEMFDSIVHRIFVYTFSLPVYIYTLQHDHTCF